MFDFIYIDTLAALLLVVAALNAKRITTFNLSKVRLRSSEWEPVGRNEVPIHAAHLLACAESSLNRLGFRFASALAAEPPITVDPRPRIFGTLHWHPQMAVLAAVELAEPLSGQATKVHFLTVFTDGMLLLTTNREQFMLFPLPGKVVVVDPYADDLEHQWQAHQEAVAREGAHSTIVREPGEVIRHHAAIGVVGSIAHMQQLGWTRKESEKHWRLTPKGAWHYAGQLLKPPKVARNAIARAYRHEPAPDVKAMRLAEMDTVAANIALASEPTPAWLKATLLTLTLLLSTLLFGWGFGLLQAVALILVLIIHELGHLAAMWGFGYKNLSIFFLPFLGAAASGHKPHATPWQEAIVLLAGPVTGLILAFAAIQIPSEALPLSFIEFVRAFVWFSLVLNLFNLLPFGVLDGGRLFELAVLGRFPYARAVFAVIGAAIGLLYALETRSVLFGLAMVFLLASTGLQFKAARVIRAIRARARSVGKRSLKGATIITALGREFTQGEYGDNGPHGWTQRMNLARLAYPRLLQGIPGLGVTVGVLATQGTALLLPLVFVASLWGSPEALPLMRTTAEERQLAEQQHGTSPESIQAKAALDEFAEHYRAQTGAEAKWTMLDRREQEMVENDDYEPQTMQWIMQQRTALIEQLPPNHPARLKYQLEMVKHGAPDATQVILAVIGELTAHGTKPVAELEEERLLLLLNAYRRLIGETPPHILEAQATTLDALWTALESPNHTLVAQRPFVTSLQAHMAYRAGHLDEAETWMKRGCDPYREHWCLDQEDGRSGCPGAWKPASTTWGGNNRANS